MTEKQMLKEIEEYFSQIPDAPESLVGKLHWAVEGLKYYEKAWRRMQADRMLLQPFLSEQEGKIKKGIAMQKSAKKMLERMEAAAPKFWEAWQEYVRNPTQENLEKMEKANPGMMPPTKKTK